MNHAEIIELAEKAKLEFQKRQYQSSAVKFRQCCEELVLLQADPVEIAEMRNNLAVALLRSGDPNAAFDSVSGTNEIFARAGDIQKQAIALANLGSILEAQKKFEEAVEAYQKAVDLFRECGEKQMLSITLRSLSDLQLKTGKRFSAVDSLQASYQEKPNSSFKDKFFSSALGQLLRKMLGH